jgi:hypothetical protein
MGTKIAMPEISFNAPDISLVRLPTQNMTYYQRCFRRSIQNLNINPRYQTTATTIIIIIIHFNDNDDSIQSNSLFIYVMSSVANGQLQSQHKYKQQTTQDKTNKQKNKKINNKTKKSGLAKAFYTQI